MIIASQNGVRRTQIGCLNIFKGEDEMTRLDRILNLLEEYDDLLDLYVQKSNHIPSHIALERLRKEKEKLTQELIEHGCRRKY